MVACNILCIDCSLNRRGPLLEQSTNKSRQRLYLSEQARSRLSPLFCCSCFDSLHPTINTVLLLVFLLQTDGSVPNTIVIATCDVVKPRVAAGEHISQVLSHSISSSFFFLLFLKLCDLFIFQFNEEARSLFVKTYKTIIHPGGKIIHRFNHLTR